jgi:hypothetical protein
MKQYVKPNIGTLEQREQPVDIMVLPRRALLRARPGVAMALPQKGPL